MGSFIGFYWKKSIYNLKNQWLIIFSISIAISMIVGLSFYNNALFSYQFNKSFDFVPDFEISHKQIYGEHHSAIPKLEYSLNFEKDYNEVMNAISRSSLQIEKVCQYGILSIEEGFWVHNQWATINPLSTVSLFDYQRKLNATEIEFIVFDNNFYNSSRFKQYFKVIEGTTPNNPNEILIEYRFAQQLGLKTNQTTNITMLIGSDLEYSPPIVQYKAFQLKNVTISGIYLAVQNEYVFDTEHFIYSYTYEDYLTNREIPFSISKFDEPAMFSYYNFSGPDMQHPFQILHQEIAQDEWYYQYLRTSYTRSGYFLMYNREMLDFNQIRHQISTIQSASQNLSIYLPIDHGFVDLLSGNMKLFYDDFKQSKFLFQLIYMPIILFSLTISILLMKSSKKKKEKELFYLKSMGIKNKILNKIIIFDGFINALIGSSLGIVLGFGTFYLYDQIFHDIFLKEIGVNLNPEMNISAILWGFILSIIINFISIIQILRMISRLNLEKLTQKIKIEEDYSANLDEFILFSAKTKKKHSIKNSELKSENYFNNKAKIETVTNEKLKYTYVLFKKIKLLFGTKIFKEEKEEWQNQVSVKTWLLLFFGAIPIILFFLLILKNKLVFSDLMIDFFSTLQNNYEIIEFSFFIGVIMIIIGIVRIISLERPKFYARLVKIISHITLGEFDKYISVNLIGKKKWNAILIQLTLLFSGVIALNILSNTTSNYLRMPEVFQIGADVNISYEDPYFKNQSDILSFENKFRNLSDLTNQKIIEDLAFYYKSEYCYYSQTLELNPVTQRKIQVISLETNKYLTIFSQNKVLDVNPNLYSSLKGLIKFNQENDNFTGIIVSSHFLRKNNLDIGDRIMISLHYYGVPDNQQYIDHPVQIIGAIDIFPGVYYSSTNDISDIILIDYNEALTENEALLGEEFHSLIKLKEFSKNTNQELLYNIMLKFLSNYCKFPIIQFQDPDWDEISPIKIGNQGNLSNIFGLLYYDFIIIGFFVVGEIAILSQIFLNSSKPIEKRLLGRGMKKNQLITIRIVEFGIILITALIISIPIGSLTALSFIKFELLSNSSRIAGEIPSDFTFPIFSDLNEISQILCIFLIIALSIFTISNFINRFFQKKETSLKISMKKVQRKEK
ncbi:FtsX-like permease family protein [Candidatus Harpocratesius sp.]